MRADDVYAVLNGRIRKVTEQIAGIATPIIYKGSVDTVENLPTNPGIGWMYNIAQKSIYGEAGMNVAWTGTVWDALGPIVDMSLYMTKEESEKKLDKNQGTENSGKVAGINENGEIVPMFPIGIEYNEDEKRLEFGSDERLNLNAGIQLDRSLRKTGYAADAGETGKKFNELKGDLENKIGKPSIEDNDKVPRAKNGEVEWVEQGLPTDEQTKNAVNEYLTEHPVQPYDDEKINNEISNLKHIVSGTEYNLRTVKVQWENGWINDETGKDADSSIINGRSIWYELEDTYITTRVISYDDTKEGYLAYRVFFYDENKNMVSKTSYKPAKNLFIISDIAPENASYFRLKQYTPDVYDIDLQYGYVETIGVVEQVEALSNTPSKSFSVIPKRNFVRPIVSIIDDDGHNQFYDVYKPYLERGIPVASAIDPVHWCGHDDRFMNWDKIYELKRLGCEFIVHGYGPWKYPNSYYPDEQSLRDFFEEIQKEFKEHGLTGWDLGVYPQGETHSNLRSVCQEYFRGCFNVSPTDGLYYVKPPIKTYNIQRYPWINYTLDNAKSIIDETYDNNGWLVLYAHSYSFDEDKKQMFSDIIDYVQEKGIEIVTNSEAMDRFQNILQIGDYYSDSTTSNCRVIGCDGTEFNYPKVSDIKFSLTSEGLLHIEEV